MKLLLIVSMAKLEASLSSPPHTHTSTSYKLHMQAYPHIPLALWVSPPLSLISCILIWLSLSHKKNTHFFSHLSLAWTSFSHAWSVAHTCSSWFPLSHKLSFSCPCSLISLWTFPQALMESLQHIHYLLDFLSTTHLFWVELAHTLSPCKSKNNHEF